MANWYVSSAGWTAVTPWAALTVTTTGTIRRQLATPTQGNERCFRCTTGGTTGGAEPSWTLTANGTTADGTVVWTECTGQEAYQSAGNWTAPSATLNLIIASSGGRSTNAADQVFVANDHSESWSSARSWALFGTKCCCVTVAGSALPPTNASRSTGAVAATTGAINLALSSSGGVYDGITFNVGTGNNTAHAIFGISGGGNKSTLTNCQINLVSTNTSSRIRIGASNASVTAWFNTPVSFGNASQKIEINVQGSSLYWASTPNAVQGSVPTNLVDATFGGLAYATASFQFYGLDLSAVNTNLFQFNSGSNFWNGQVQVVGCKVHASATLANNFLTAGPGSLLWFSCTDSASGADENRLAAGSGAGAIYSNRSVVRSGGASDGTQGMSWRVATAATGTYTATFGMHPITPWIGAWNTSIGASVNVTVNGVANKAALPDASNLWIEAGYNSEASAPLLSSALSGGSPLTITSPASVTATSEDWGTALTQRANSTTYGVGDVIGVSSNPLRVFFCTASGGPTAGSLPAGYATAVDGGSVTDGAATFRAGWRFSVTVAVTPQKVGVIQARIHAEDPQAVPTDVYIDNKLVVT